MQQNKPKTNFDLLRDSCLNFQARKLGRILSSYYDNRIFPKCGLVYSQFCLLLGIATHEKDSPTNLAYDLCLDRTTVVRNLRPLIASGLVEYIPGQDKRTRNVLITDLGRNVLTEALAAWQIAYEELQASVGSVELDATNEAIKAITPKCFRITRI